MPDFSPKVFLDSFGDGAFDSSWRFSDYHITLSANEPAEVTQVLLEVEEAVASGRYAVGFVTYEAASALNPDLPSLPPVEGLPLAWFAIFRERYNVDAGAGLSASSVGVELEPLKTLEEYTKDVDRIREYIAAGDCYQVNQTFPLKGRFNGDPLALYHRIGRGQRAPFCSYLDTGRFTILSASPELFFSLKEGKISTRPMKGTARRGRWATEDQEAAELLRQSPKERAENLMIVDLLRNDLGILAETGSVSVDAMFEVETYPTVHQMTSTITGTLREGAGVADIFRALFPCGSVTGAPKRRSMGIIEELERIPRGVYCGAIGFVAPGGEALFSVAIRTLLLDRSSGGISLGVGSGITWDSLPEREYSECLDKGAFVNSIEDDYGLIESLRLENGVYTLLNRHLARLEASANYFGFVFDQKSVRQELLNHAKEMPGLCKTRLLLSPDGSVGIISEPLTVDSGTPLRIAVSDVRVDSSDRFRYHKTTRRELIDTARSARPECDELLFLNERGELTEGSYHTLVVKLDGHLLTPPISSGLLPGVLREELLERGKISERILYPDDLKRAGELWLVNSVRGWRPSAMVTHGGNVCQN
ncbi:MAG: aminodeoxychorismate synthase component I [Desulfuromonadaceae bacterium]|nr:aminodeoxychorismate synthase component I [Desulfuromonadaceae bacterium]